MWVLCTYLYFVGHQYLIEACLGDNQRTNIIWVHIQNEEKGTTFANLSTTLKIIHNWVTHVFRLEINKLTLVITIIYQRSSNSQ
jgi:hypothetical protein